MTKPLTTGEEAALRATVGMVPASAALEQRIWATLDAEREAHAKEVEAHKRTREALKALYTFPGVKELLAPKGSLGSIADAVDAALATEAER